MTTFAILIAILIALVAGTYGVIKWKSFARRHRAAVNVLLAKHTYGTLSERDRRRVQDQVVSIFKEVQYEGSVEFDNETQRYGWYALAMAELEIAPAVQAYVHPKWYLVRNPFVAISPTDKLLTMVSNYLRDKHGVNVTIDPEDKYMERLKALINNPH